MRIFRVVLLLVHALVVSRLASGAAVDRYENDRQRHTAVINFLGTTKDKRVEDESRNTGPTTLGNGWEAKEEEYGDEYYYEDEYQDDMSGDYEVEMPQVAMSSKPKDSSAILEAESKTRRGKERKKGRGKGKKRDPCLKKYKDFCIHGTCRYLRDIRAPSCVCHPDYSGERCEFFTLPVQSPEGYNRTTALAVVAVVLSSVCLTIIGLLLMLRFHKRGAYDVENEEKVKLGLVSNH
ncbi:heparin-binding EGF-like growth factor a [Mastacembelus armatus]|uniref:Proheparin-binding EGF-like growth factor n=1 Tax=Mastacembelus armatus TaxID=205130 RepID=A0A3Q3M705_9TELE|nr:proheparin-binding EGF-like growth factor [Mastacembelus armatus]XP_033181302.1 proheparin-binding EGF-like growth factor [Mastacembelus armatus]